MSNINQTPIGVQISQNPDIQQDLTFDEYQIQQFQIFEQKYGGVDTEIRKHPEWNGTFMNFFLHAEGEGKVDLAPYYIVAEWLREHPLPSDQSVGQLGCDSTIVSNLLKVVQAGGSLPKELPTGSDGLVDEYMLKFELVRDSYVLAGHEKLISGRLCINDISFMEEGFIYSEGNKTAEDIFSSLGSMNQHVQENSNSFERMGMSCEIRMANNMFNHMSIKLTFDDMNIRGVQIIDALEYAGSLDGLYKCVSRPYPQDTRDPDLVRYVNMKAAQRIRDGISKKEYIAVTGGASFDKEGMICGWQNPDLIPYKYRMSLLNYDEYLEDVKSLGVDWKSIDIINDTPLDEAIKAAEARGFTLVRKTNGVMKWGKMSYGILMYNEKNGAFLSMPSAQDSNACFGGCDLDFWCKNGSIPFTLLQHGSSGGVNGIDDLRWHQLTYQSGLFAEFDKVTDLLSADVIEWDKLGFGGTDNIPVPQYYTKPFVRMDSLAMDIGYDVAHMLDDLGGYRLQLLINTLLAHYDSEFDTSHCKQYELIKDESIAFISAIEQLSIYSVSNLEEALKLLRLAQLWMKMPDEEYKKILECLRLYLATKDEKARERMNDPNIDDMWRERMMEDFESLVEAYEENGHIALGFENDSIVVEKALSCNDNTVESTGVKLPWM